VDGFKMKVHERLKKHVLVDGFPVVADTKKSLGSWITDAETGLEYLDCYSMHAGMALGWNHPKLVDRKNELADAAINKIANSDCYTKYYADFVDGMAKIAPDFEHFFFIDGGSLAVENALKASFDYKAQRLIKRGRVLPSGGTRCNSFLGFISWTKRLYFKHY